MPREIQTKPDAWAGITCTIAALAAGAARQSSFFTNTNRRPAALFLLRIQSGAVAPTAGTIYELFLLRANDSGQRTDNAGSSDAAITINNAQLIGTLQVTANANTNFCDEFDTAPLGRLGNQFAYAIRNSTNQALNGTETNHVKQHAPYVPEIQ